MRYFIFLIFTLVFSFQSFPSIAKTANEDFANSAIAACKNYDAHGFIDALARSKMLSHKFVSPKMKIVKFEGKKQIVKTINKKNYQFPILIWDNYFVLNQMGKKTKPIYLKLETNQSQSNQIVVEFYPVDYKTILENYDGMVKKIGPSQKLYFEPYGQCWQLVEHVIYGNENSK